MKIFKKLYSISIIGLFITFPAISLAIKEITIGSNNQIISSVHNKKAEPSEKAKALVLKIIKLLQEKYSVSQISNFALKVKELISSTKDSSKKNLYQYLYNEINKIESMQQNNQSNTVTNNISDPLPQKVNLVNSPSTNYQKYKKGNDLFYKNDYKTRNSYEIELKTIYNQMLENHKSIGYNNTLNDFFTPEPFTNSDELMIIAKPYFWSQKCKEEECSTKDYGLSNYLLKSIYYNINEVNQIYYKHTYGSKIMIVNDYIKKVINEGKYNEEELNEITKSYIDFLSTKKRITSTDYGDTWEIYSKNYLDYLRKQIKLSADLSSVIKKYRSNQTELLNRLKEDMTKSIINDYDLTLKLPIVFEGLDYSESCTFWKRDCKNPSRVDGQLYDILSQKIKGGNTSNLNSNNSLSNTTSNNRDESFNAYQKFRKKFYEVLLDFRNNNFYLSSIFEDNYFIVPTKYYTEAEINNGTAPKKEMYKVYNTNEFYSSEEFENDKWNIPAGKVVKQFQKDYLETLDKHLKSLDNGANLESAKSTFSNEINIRVGNYITEIASYIDKDEIGKREQYKGNYQKAIITYGEMMLEYKTFAKAYNRELSKKEFDINNKMGYVTEYLSNNWLPSFFITRK